MNLIIFGNLINQSKILKFTLSMVESATLSNFTRLNSSMEKNQSHIFLCHHLHRSWIFQKTFASDLIFRCPQAQLSNLASSCQDLGHWRDIAWLERKLRAWKSPLQHCIIVDDRISNFVRQVLYLQNFQTISKRVFRKIKNLFLFKKKKFAHVGNLTTNISPTPNLREGKKHLWQAQTRCMNSWCLSRVVTLSDSSLFMNLLHIEP